MRRIIFALLLLSALGWTEPSRAQWWGWGGPCIGAAGPGFCSGGGWAPPGRIVELVPMGRPRAGPVAFGPRRFAGLGWAPGWRFWAWRREMRLRRIANWRRWIEASRRAEPSAEPQAPWFRRRVRSSSIQPEVAMRGGAVGPRVRERARPPVPRLPADEHPAAAAVALMPAAARLSRPHVPAAVSPRLLAAAVRRPALPSARPAPVAPAALRGPAASARPERRSLQPAVLRSEPAPPAAAPARQPVPASPVTPAASPTPAGAEPVPAAPADVPVAPLD